MAAEESHEMIGSASWTGADDYGSGTELHDRATEFFAAVKWDFLASLCSGLREGTPCQFRENYSIGHFNMVRRIIFDDGTSWVARLRMPATVATYSGYEESSFKIEVACLKFLKEKTSIPVPEIYHHNFDPANSVGAPYILMTYINGTCANDLRSMKECETGMYGTPDQDRRFREQMASIQVELSSFKFSQIGSLYQNEETQDFFIGPEIETGKGPWSTPMEYYNELVNHLLQECIARSELEVQTCDSFALPILFRHLISVYGENCNKEGSFALTNRDYGAHNLLVNDNFEIIGVIDFDGIMAAPIEEVAQYPRLTGLNWEPLGKAETRPLAIARIKETEPRLDAYRDMIRAAEIRVGGSNNGATPIADKILSDAAKIFGGMIGYACHEKLFNDVWMEEYLRFLRNDLLRIHQPTIDTTSLIPTGDFNKSSSPKTSIVSDSTSTGSPPDAVRLENKIEGDIETAPLIPRGDLTDDLSPEDSVVSGGTSAGPPPNQAILYLGNEMASSGVAQTPCSSTSTHTIAPIHIRTKIGVFCAASPGKSEAHMAAARSLAEAFHKHNVYLVYGGGRVGLMGELARNLVNLSGPDSVHGIMPAALVKHEQGSNAKPDSEGGVEEEPIYGRTTIVNDMHTRKNTMAKEVIAGGPGSGFIALSGGYGTLEEIMEMVTWHQLGIHDRGIVFLNVEGYWDGILQWVKTSFEQELIKNGNETIIVEAKDGEEAIMALQNYKPSIARLKLKWDNDKK